MNQRSILVIEDDRDIVELLRYNLERENFNVFTARSGEAGMDLVWTESPSLILLDLGLPGIQGLDVCRKLKQQSKTAAIPIMMLTARGEESDIVLGLELGADDYMTKPFKVRELIARVRAVLRRSELASISGQPEVEAPIVAGPLSLDPVQHEARLDGELLNLTLAEYRLLRALVRNQGRVLTRQRLLSFITEGTAHITERNVDVHIRALRKKLGSDREMIRTIRGVGYRFTEP
jgi:DNA-binding response OmpR family regulator